MPLTQAQIDQARHDIENSHCSEERAGGGPREMGVVPYSKKPNGEIDRERRGGEEKPFTVRWFNLGELPNQWINDRRERETGIKTSATSADCKLMFGDEKRALRNLMADVAEGSVDRQSPG